MGLDLDIMKLARTHVDSSDGCYAIFHHETCENLEQSEIAGTPVYEAVQFVEIIAPGNDKEIVDRKVKESDKLRWPEQWRRFLEGVEEPDFDGLPVTEWPQINNALARTLHEAKIYTVEQLAEVADVNLQTLGPGMSGLKVKAVAWVKLKNKEISVTKVRAELKEGREEIEKLKEMGEALKAQIKLLQPHTDEIPAEPEKPKPKPKKRGRPKGSTNK
jgi:hypothetical protein